MKKNFREVERECNEKGWTLEAKEIPYGVNLAQSTVHYEITRPSDYGLQLLGYSADDAHSAYVAALATERRQH